jgi:tetratricopeptide (TPR) repeat protein/tRNA A-37 threonylcarbamoyl transferase component Bud32
LRYRILQAHAKGGLGEIFLAEDLELHRTVALKEIRDRYAHDPQSRGRFILEAEVTGRLEHPGIVPVYGLGQYSDGRPFYAMRLIEGETLKEAARQFHAADEPGRDPDERRRALRELLRRFIDVCNAVAYAHCRGVLHRDLKPANVMLGSFGETLIVDWGLAKPLDPSALGIVEGTALRPQFEEAAAGTLMGVAIGTPAYMSPEQAAGRQDLLGPASDIYSLGATLYYLLTGQAPFHGRDVQQILRQVQAGNFLPPRHVNRKVPTVLEAICLKAMAREPGNRYPSALALAQDVEHWLADEPVVARREPLWERLLRFCRRRPILATWIAFGLAENLALLVALGGALLLSFGVSVKPMWLNALVFAPFLGFLWLLGTAGAMSGLAWWLGLVGLVVGFVLAGYQAAFARKGRRKKATLAAALGGKVGLTVGPLLGYAGSIYFLDRVVKQQAESRSALMWAAIAAGALGPVLGVGLGLVRKARWETRWKRARLGAALGVLLGVGTCFTLSYVDLMRRPSDPTLLKRNSALANQYQSSPRGRLKESALMHIPQTGNIRALDAAGQRAAEEIWQKSTLEYEQKVRQNPNDSALVLQLASDYLLRGELAKSHARPEERIDWYNKAIGVLEPILRKKPSQAGLQELLVSCYRARARAQADFGRPAEALTDWDHALKLNPWTDRQEMRLQRALTLAQLGDHAQAVAEADALSPSKDLRGKILYTFARVYALAASKSSADQTLSRKYAVRGVAALALAKQAGYFEGPGPLELLQRDADFKVLRERKEFTELFGKN